MRPEGWEFVAIVYDGTPVHVQEVNLWEQQWLPLDEPPITVPHPTYPDQRHSMYQYRIETGSKTIKFAAGEFSNCVWGFYVPMERN